MNISRTLDSAQGRNWPCIATGTVSYWSQNDQGMTRHGVSALTIRNTLMNDFFAVAGVLMINPPCYSYLTIDSDTAIADAEEGPAIRHSAAQEVGSCKRHGSCGRSALDSKHKASFASRCFGPDAEA